ncbi:Uncharacterized protein QTN25_005431 [Entamoeba marina]
MKRSEPTKDLVKERLLSFYSTHHYKYPYNYNEQDIKEIEIKAKCVKETHDEVEDILSLVGETAELLSTLHDSFGNEDFSLPLIPIIMHHQLLPSQINNLTEEINDLKGYHIYECVVPIDKSVVTCYVFREDFNNYLKERYPKSLPLVNKLMNKIAIEGGPIIDPTWITPQERLELQQKGLIYEIYGANKKQYKLTIPNHSLFSQNVIECRKKVKRTVQSSIFHSINKEKLEDRYDRQCFKFDYILCDLLGKNIIRWFVDIKKNIINYCSDIEQEKEMIKLNIE